MEDLITIEEAAKEFSRSQSWIWIQIRDRKLTQYKSGGDRRAYIDRNQLRDLVRIRPVDSQAQSA